jgi:hypothetical protein
LVVGARAACKEQWMALNGAEGMSEEQLLAEIDRGARIVVFEYCVSLLVVSFKRPSAPYLFRPGEGRIVKALPWILITFLFGWWGIPWGFIYTPWVLILNFGGGRDVTAEVMANLVGSAPEPGPHAAG